MGAHLLAEPPRAAVHAETGCLVVSRANPVALQAGRQAGSRVSSGTLGGQGQCRAGEACRATAAQLTAHSLVRSSAQRPPKPLLLRLEKLGVRYASKPGCMSAAAALCSPAHDTRERRAPSAPPLPPLPPPPLPPLRHAAACQASLAPAGVPMTAAPPCCSQWRLPPLLRLLPVSPCDCACPKVRGSDSPQMVSCKRGRGEAAALSPLRGLLAALWWCAGVWPGPGSAKLGCLLNGRRRRRRRAGGGGPKGWRAPVRRRPINLGAGRAPHLFTSGSCVLLQDAPG